MSTIHGTSGASHAAQLQWLQSIQHNNQDPLVQHSGSDPMSFGLDPFTSNASQTSGGSSGPPFSLGAMSALIDAQEQSSNANGLSNQQQKVFNELGPNGTGSITKSQLESDFGSDNKDLADAVFARLDTNGDGSISQSEFGAGTTRTMHHHHHLMMLPPDDSQSTDGTQSGLGAQGPLTQLLNANGASSTSTANSDGSTTTTITYQDGSKVTMTTAANTASTDGSTSTSTTSSSNSNSTQQNLLEQLIKMQSQLIQQMASSASSSTSLATV